MLQNIAYIIDIYREDIRPQKDIAKFAALIVMFPKIIAGPLVAADEFEKQLDKRKLSVGKISDGILLFLRGLSKKVILGNGMEMVFETIRALPAGRFLLQARGLGVSHLRCGFILLLEGIAIWQSGLAGRLALSCRKM